MKNISEEGKIVLIKYILGYKVYGHTKQISGKESVKKIGKIFYSAARNEYRFKPIIATHFRANELLDVAEALVELNKKQ